MKIFVSIASYCDKLLFFTLKSCIENAKFPQNIVFGIVDQDEQSAEEKIKELSYSNQIRYLFIHKLETFGACWARSIASSLYDGEDFLLQIDSHMLFEKNWDEKLISQYNEVKKLSPKPILTAYPYDFSLDENGKPFVRSDGLTIDKDNNFIFNNGKNIYTLQIRPSSERKLENGNVALLFITKFIETTQHIYGCHIAAGFLFTSGAFIDEVPYDPFLYFHGEEQNLSIRAFSKGWDIFHPHHIPLLHCYKIKEDKIDQEWDTHHWHSSTKNARAITFNRLQKRSHQRLYKLLYTRKHMKDSAYGLGNIRDLNDYAEISGIDYIKQKFTTDFNPLFKPIN